MEQKYNFPTEERIIKLLQAAENNLQLGENEQLIQNAIASKFQNSQYDAQSLIYDLVICIDEAITMEHGDKKSPDEIRKIGQDLISQLKPIIGCIVEDTHFCNNCYTIMAVKTTV